MIAEDITFQQDNAPIHKYRLVINWIAHNNINVMEWPAQSPDLNPIENEWSHMKMELDIMQITSKTMLRTKIQ